MIEGMPASSSMAMPIGWRSRGVHNSLRKMAMPSPTGMAMTSAIAEVTSVP